MNKYLATYGKPRFLGVIQSDDDMDESIAPGKLIVVKSHRGEELAEVVGGLTDEQEKEYRSLRTISEHGEGPVRGGDPVVTDLHFVRFPLEGDLILHGEQSASEDGVLRVAHELVIWHKLPIKLVDAEFLLDEKKLFFYFTSDQRVDFRTLVKDLARRFKTRIELRQMGVRDEARIIKGLSSCGLPCCCSYWLNQFSPIGIRMVKEQNIALNPAKISGICGRLMCCMAYEHKVYKDLWNGLPGPGSKIKTPNGNYIVLAIDVAKEALRCHRPSGGDILVPIEFFGEFKQTVLAGKEWEPPQAEEAETKTISRVSCADCRSANRSQCLKSAQAGEEREENAVVRANSEEKMPSASKPPRRRGRRGGRGNKDASPLASVNEKKTAKPARLNSPQNAGETGNAGVPKERDRQNTLKETGEPKGPKRPRRRRRRPKRPASGLQDSQEITG